MSTLSDTLKRLWPDASEKQHDELLWITPFPFTNLEKIVSALEVIREKYGTSIKDAVDGEMDEFDNAWKDHMNRQGAHP